MAGSHGSRNRFVSLVVGIALAYPVGTVYADFTFGKPQDLGLGSGGGISVSADGLELYFTSARAGGLGYEDIWVSTRQSVHDPWGPPTNLQTVNSSYREAFSSLSPDGLSLYFCDYFYGPDRPGGLGHHDLWMSTRANREAPWSTPVNMGAPFNSPQGEVAPTISHDGLTLLFASTRNSGNYDLWMCSRSRMEEAWGTPVRMGTALNSGSHDYYGNLSPDGLVLFFESNRSGDYKGWMAMRKTVSDPWEPAVPLPEPMYSMGVGCVSTDGKSFYAATSQVPIIPIVDFTGDGRVDGKDVLSMARRWDQGDLTFDIGPMPWGDNSVDVEDLKALAGYIGEEVTDPTLIAHWALDETEGDVAHDNVGGNDGTVTGDAGWQPEGGSVGGALELDGIDDSVLIDLILNPDEGAFSLLAWIKGGAPGQVIVSQADAKIGRLNYPGCSWLGFDAVGALTTDLVGSESASATSEVIITDGRWHRVALVWDKPSKTSTLHVDGLEIGDHLRPTLPEAYGGLQIGVGRSAEPKTLFTGLIDDVRIYNRAVKP
jgi:hypothetical protein